MLKSIDTFLSIQGTCLKNWRQHYFEKSIRINLVCGKFVTQIKRLSWTSHFHLQYIGKGIRMVHNISIIKVFLITLFINYFRIINNIRLEHILAIQVAILIWLFKFCKNQNIIRQLGKKILGRSQMLGVGTVFFFVNVDKTNTSII